MPRDGDGVPQVANDINVCTRRRFQIFRETTDERLETV